METVTATIYDTTERYLGQWQRLVSTTNWDKGRIIGAWRKALEESEAPASEYSDEAWSRRVGNVTPQHVGRLRRTWERFGSVANDYPRLYWSHFQAATDWEDAEMWLEGASQTSWSVVQMRNERAVALGLVDEQAESADAATAEVDEDGEPLTGEARSAVRETVVQDPRGSNDEHGRHERSSFDSTADSDDDSSHSGADDESDGHAGRDTFAAAETRQPFAELPSLPLDVSEAFESFKLCILRHKLSGWAEVSRGDILASLDALKELAIAPATE